MSYTPLGFMAINTCSTVLFSLYKSVQLIIGWWISIKDLMKRNKPGCRCKHLHCTTAADVYVEPLWILSHSSEKRISGWISWSSPNPLRLPTWCWVCRGTPPALVWFSVWSELSSSFKPPSSSSWLLICLLTCFWSAWSLVGNYTVCFP